MPTHCKRQRGDEWGGWQYDEESDAPKKEKNTPLKKQNGLEILGRHPDRNTQLDAWSIGITAKADDLIRTSH
jgi:hypothetical protein